MTPLANSFYAWKLTHERHHAFTQLRGQDVDWACFLVTRDELESPTSRPPLITRAGYAMPCGIFLWIAWNTIRRAAMTHQMFRSERLARHWMPLAASNVAMTLCLIGLYGALWNAFGFMGMLKYHGIPATVAMVTSWIIITIQHANEQTLWYEPEGWTPVRGQLVSTFDIRFPAWLEYLWCDGNIHIPHHVAARIPWYHLKRAGRAIQAAYPAYYQEHRFTLSHLSWLWRTPFLERVPSRQYYVLSSHASR
jgi:omega-6 fatty acid desaturase (delta-12 desaturase)